MRATFHLCIAVVWLYSSLIGDRNLELNCAKQKEGLITLPKRRHKKWCFKLSKTRHLVKNKSDKCHFGLSVHGSRSLWGASSVAAFTCTRTSECHSCKFPTSHNSSYIFALDCPKLWWHLRAATGTNEFKQKQPYLNRTGNRGKCLTTQCFLCANNPSQNPPNQKYE